MKGCVIIKINWKALIWCIAIPLFVGALSGILTIGGMQNFNMVAKPPLSPPGWIFPVVWTILYTLMGIASYLVLYSKKSAEQISKALTTYAVQLGFNFFWSIIFFNLKEFLFAFFWLVALLVFILITTVQFWKIDQGAGALMLPYILWVIFAGYLNYAIYLLN